MAGWPWPGPRLCLVHLGGLCGLCGESAREDRQRLPAANGGGGRQPGAGEIDVPLREPLQDLLERDAPFQTGERRAEAKVDAVAEGEVLEDLAVDVEAVALGEAAVVAIGRSDQEHHDAARRYLLSVVLDVAGHIPGEVRRGRFVAQYLLDRVRDQ